MRFVTGHEVRQKFLDFFAALVVKESSFSHRKDAEAAEATRRKPLRISPRSLWVLCASAVKTALQHASSV
jgi:hypothetical protein